ncbi:MAG: ATPase, T2SS/T4P/T4SS family [Phycisphaeraceae bacterium]|nr:ATPase, T2SS/T4P/T4SS family [Phycisphaeraceae bacterium]
MAIRIDFIDWPSVRPIRELMLDPQVTEIMINGPQAVFIERGGRMQQAEVSFESPEQLMALVDSLVDNSGRSVSVSRPYVDFTLPDGSRINVVVPPVAVAGAAITIRKFTKTLGSLEDLIRVGTLDERMAWLLCSAVTAKMNIIFSGATGSGKTTLLNILSGYIRDNERVVTVEDTAELTLRQANVVRLECRPPNLQNQGRVEMAELVRNALRMRPNRIIIGEIRGDEAVDLLTAISSGHEGCLSILHASSPRDALRRLEMFTLQRGLGMPLWAIHRQIAAAIDLIVQMEMLQDGTRRVTAISEVGDLEEDNQIGLRDLFTYEVSGYGQDGKVEGRFECAGVEPNFLIRFARQKVEVPPGLFRKGAGT